MKKNKIILIFIHCLCFIAYLKPLTLRIINKTGNRYVTIILPNSKNFIVMPNRVPIVLNISSKENTVLLYGLSRTNNFNVCRVLGSIPLKDALKNPYPNGVSEVEINKGMINPISFYTYLIDSQGIVRLSPGELNEWDKVLGISKRASAEEILYKGGRLTGFSFSKELQNQSSIKGITLNELEELYKKLKKEWRDSYNKIWKKINMAYEKVYLKVLEDDKI